MYLHYIPLPPSSSSSSSIVTVSLLFFQFFCSAFSVCLVMLCVYCIHIVPANQYPSKPSTQVPKSRVTATNWLLQVAVALYLCHV